MNISYNGIKSSSSEVREVFGSGSGRGPVARQGHPQLSWLTQLLTEPVAVGTSFYCIPYPSDIHGGSASRLCQIFVCIHSASQGTETATRASTLSNNSRIPRPRSHPVRARAHPCFPLLMPPLPLGEKGSGEITMEKESQRKKQHS